MQRLTSDEAETERAEVEAEIGTRATVDRNAIARRHLRRSHADSGYHPHHSGSLFGEPVARGRSGAVFKARNAERDGIVQRARRT